MSSAPKPRVMIVGGPDVAARLPLMRRLSDEFELVAVGCGEAAAGAFAAEGFAYRSYAALHARVSPIDDARGFLELAQIFRRDRPRIVHTFDTKAGVWGCLAARAAGVPVAICTVNGVGVLFREDTWKRRLLGRAYRVLQRFASSVSQATVFQNPDDAREFVSRGLVRPERVVLVPGSGVRTDVLDPTRFPSDERARLRAELGLGPEHLVVIMVTRVIRSKGVLEVLAAARALRGTHPHVRFVLVGAHEPENMDHLEPSELRALESELLWLGARSDVPALLAASDVMAFPSGYGEGIPRVLLEAAAMALPIVTTDAPGCREVVEPGRSGVLVPIGDAAALERALRELVDDPALRLRFGAAARERAVARFDLGVVCERTRGLYRDLLLQRSSRGATVRGVA